MSKGHKVMLWTGLLALLLTFPVSVALAQEGTEPPLEQTLMANGYGLAQIGGWGSVDIHAHGGSIIWIANADTLEISGDGGREEIDGGVVKLTNWAGEIHATGQRFAVRLVGGQLDFSATGRGRAFLLGYGTFQIDDHQGRWTWRGVHIPRRPPFIPLGEADLEGLDPAAADASPDTASYAGL